MGSEDICLFSLILLFYGLLFWFVYLFIKCLLFCVFVSLFCCLVFGGECLGCESYLSKVMLLEWKLNEVI